MPMISIVMPCYNEEGNVAEACRRVKEVFATLPGYTYEHIFMDNASTDRTVQILKEIAREDRNVKIIVNTRNFGHIRSPFYGYLQASGDAIVAIVSDLQEPPELIYEFVKKWEEGYKIVMGVKSQSRETPAMFFVRKMYYKLIGHLAEIELTKNFSGFGLYDRKVVDILKEISDPYPYFRGLVADIGFERAEIEFTQSARVRGFTKNNFYSLYDTAMLGITSHSKIPLRLATMAGFTLAFLSLLVSLGYLLAKLIFWNTFSVGMAPIIIGLFFFSAVQLFFIGIIGEYIGSIQTQVFKRPLVIEKERINFG
jgi:polyisoprenyl-phosphate glycosyltransferase